MYQKGQWEKQTAGGHTAAGSDHLLPEDGGAGLAFSPAERDTIRDLKRQGWTIEEIALRCKRTPTEIELLLELPD